MSLRHVALLVVVLLVAALGCEKLAQREMHNIENQVAEDAVRQYEIAKRQGDKVQICVQAGLVSACYLQANDEPNYNKWKSIEKSDCRAAGLPDLSLSSPTPEPPQANAADPHFLPVTVEKTTGNFLVNPDFEGGSSGWRWLDWSAEWGPFEVTEGKAASGSKSAHLAVSGTPGESATRVFGVVQEITPAAFPSRISGHYYVERWEPGTAKKVYAQVVIIAMQALGDLPRIQIRYVLEGVTEQPYNMSNARYVFVHRRTQPETDRWIDFSLDVRADFRRLWGSVPPDGTPFRVLFEARYDDKPGNGTVSADVYFDDLFVGVPTKL